MSHEEMSVDIDEGTFTDRFFFLLHQPPYFFPQSLRFLFYILSSVVMCLQVPEE